MLSRSAAADDDVTAAITAVVNTVYQNAEAGLWAGDAPRANAAEVAGLVEAGEIAAARLAGRIVGSVRVRTVADGAGEFGLLAAAPDVQGAGVGRELVHFAEAYCRQLGHRRMQLELLVPRSFRHPSKDFLAAWCTRLGYRIEEKSTVEDVYPHLVPLLATPCDFFVYRKDFTTG
ncbi:GNAT family N-acetyltransferase [Amycolatopsis sp. NPDC004368]